jgi:hypothetical protein
MSIFLGSTLSWMGFVEFWIVLWKLAKNGEGTQKISMYFYVSAFKEDQGTKSKCS